MQYSNFVLREGTQYGYRIAFSGNDTILGGSGDDVLQGHAGNDLINGGDGSDTAVYSGSFSAYQLAENTGSFTISGGDEGTDTLTGIEFLRFSDQTYALSSTEKDTGKADDDTPKDKVEEPIVGTSVNDIFASTTSDDTFDGDTGTDTVVFGGNHGAYTLTKSGSTHTVRDNIGTDGTDTLTNVDRLQFADKKVALDITDNALETMQFIGVVAPTLKADLSIRGAVLSYFDQGRSMAEACQLALDADWIPSDNTELVKAVFKNVFETTTDPDQGTINALLPYVESLGDAGFLAAVAGLNINVDLVGLQQSGMEYA